MVIETIMAVVMQKSYRVLHVSLVNSVCVIPEHCHYNCVAAYPLHSQPQVRPLVKP